MVRRRWPVSAGADTRRHEMRIAVDAMGGDFAPTAVVTGAYQAAEEAGTSILLVGDGPTLGEILAKQGEEQPSIEIVHAEEVVGMDDPPQSDDPCAQYPPPPETPSRQLWASAARHPGPIKGEFSPHDSI